VVAVERDRELVPVLHRHIEGAFPGLPLARDPEGLTPRAATGRSNGAADPRSLTILEADAAQVDYADLARRLESPPVVCGNLPYQIASRILVAIADQARHVRRAVLMVQKEVADRVVATPGREYGLLSVLVQRSMRAGTVCRVPRSAFHPQPRVTSAVVRLEPHGELLDPATDRRLVAAARAAFANRRKTLKNCLVRGLRGDGDTVSAAVQAAGLDPGARAETLAVTDFARLGRELAVAGLLE
jgi:16S rRNA (adenine1518-N6/adenine1519-N6)-dimethyltransferase